VATILRKRIAGVCKALGGSRSILAHLSAFAIAETFAVTVQIAHAFLVEIKVGRVHAVLVGEAASWFRADSCGTVHFFSRKGRPSGGGEGASVAVGVGTTRDHIDLDGGTIFSAFLLRENRNSIVACLATLFIFAGNSSQAGSEENIVAKGCAIGNPITVSKFETLAISSAVTINGTLIVRRARFRSYFWLDWFPTIADPLALIIFAKVGSEAFDLIVQVVRIVAVLVFEAASKVRTDSVGIAKSKWTLLVFVAGKQGIRSGALHAARTVVALHGSHASGNRPSNVFLEKAIVDGRTSSHAFANSVRSAILAAVAVFVRGTRCGLRWEGFPVADNPTHAIGTGFGSDAGGQHISRVFGAGAIVQGRTSSLWLTNQVRSAIIVGGTVLVVDARNGRSFH